MTGHVKTSNSKSSGHLRPGHWWVDEKGDYHSAYGIDESFEHFFYRHLGHVKIAIDNQNVSVFWDVHSVSETALSSVMERLQDQGDRLKAHLRFFFYGWIDERYSNLKLAIDRISEVSRYKSVELIRSTYIEEHDLQEISSSTEMISNGFRLWERTQGNLKHADQGDLCAYLPHVLIFRPSKDDRELVFSHIGSKSTAASVYGATWIASAFNQKSDATLAPMNMKYDQSVSAAYSRIIETEEPRYDHVRALLHLDAHAEPFWVSYERLLTYSLLHDGSPAVICLVNQTQNVSIPLAGDS